jgi:hypothetical protein
VKPPTCSLERRASSIWLLRGAIGFAALAAALWTRAAVVSIPALVVAFVAFRGCPMCWLFQKDVR